MSKKKQKIEEGIQVVDHSKILEDLRISASFVPLIQNVLVYLIEDMPAQDIVEAYKNIDKAVKKEDVTLTFIESHMYTLTTLVQYLRSEAEKQGAVRMHESLKPKDLQPALEAFAKQDFEKVKLELEKVQGKLPTNAS